MTLPKRLLFFTCLHTLFLLPVLGMNACLAFSDSEYPSFWYAAADLLAAFLCLPLWPLLSIGRLDLFLVLIPVN
nr:hypothetical protein [Nitrospinaceae bacterium]